MQEKTNSCQLTEQMFLRSSPSSSSASSSSPKTFDRALGFVISLAGGAGLYLLHAWLKSLRHRKKLHNDSGDCARQEASGGRTRKEEEEEEEERDEQTKVWHTGSCHCDRFRFRVFAPEDLCVVEYRASSSCKLLRFPRLTLNSCDFEVAAAAENSSLSLYSVVDNFSQQKRQVGIHAFCSFCGMQVFYSPPPPEPLMSYRKGGEVVVNVDCLDKGTVNQVHVAYGGIRNMPPHTAQNNVQVPSHQQQDCQHQLQLQRMQQASLQHSNQQIHSYDRLHPLQPAEGVLVKAHPSRHNNSHGSDSSTTNPPTVSSDDEEEGGLEKRLQMYTPEDPPAQRDRYINSVNLIRHLQHEGSSDRDAQNFTRMEQFQRRHAEHWERGSYTPTDTSLLGAQLQAAELSRQHQAQTNINENISHGLQPMQRSHDLPAQQLGNSPSLYDTLPLIYNYNSNATSKSGSPLDQQQIHFHQISQQQQQLQSSFDAPVMIRGSDLALPFERAYQIEYDNNMDQIVNVGDGHSSVSDTLHHRLKIYLQQHLNDDNKS